MPAPSPLSITTPLLASIAESRAVLPFRFAGTAISSPPRSQGKPSTSRLREKRMSTSVRPEPSRYMVLLPLGYLGCRRRGGPLPPDRFPDPVACRLLLPPQLRRRRPAT